ncbi:hypothetical protein GCWU000325_00658 [Alloprevotella tannerae ATCC 51259]|uniref:Uncharacterized protein n=1 Tax=Alloprevotella tannerae ATCC 51259 TaxID=626522 RepID=C9LEM8_9BACT|nr:hypothetical protein GCWU000325_00658 [Alloprevotella tannerae ATCC 51259]
MCTVEQGCTAFNKVKAMCSDGLIKPNEGHSLSSFSLAALNARPYI